MLGDYQYLPGHCVLLAVPAVNSLNGFSLAQRAQFMLDMTLVGDAVQSACNPSKLNYTMMMNLDTYLHAHIQARYAWEPDAYRAGPAWNYPKEHRTDDKYDCAGEQYLALKEQITAALQERLESIRYWEDGKSCR